MFEKKIPAKFFGEDVVLDFGIRFSGRLRERFPDWQDQSQTDDVAKIVLLAIAPALPDKFKSKTDDEILDEVDNLEDPDIINRATLAFQSAMGFLAVALKGLINAAEAVNKSGQGKK